MEKLKFEIIGENDICAFVGVKNRYEGTKEVHYSKWVPDQRGAFALQLLERMGLVTAEDNGEDTAGRAKIRNKTPREVVDYAFEVVELAFEKIDEKGWGIELNPDIEARVNGYPDDEIEKVA